MSDGLHGWFHGRIAELEACVVEVAEERDHFKTALRDLVVFVEWHKERRNLPLHMNTPNTGALLAAQELLAGVHEERRMLHAEAQGVASRGAEVDEVSDEGPPMTARPIEEIEAALDRIQLQAQHGEQVATFGDASVVHGAIRELAAFRERHNADGTTHSDRCWRWHVDCAVREVDRLRSVLAQTVEALEHCRHRPHEHNPGPDFIITRCEVIDRALSAARSATTEET